MVIPRKFAEQSWLVGKEEILNRKPQTKSGNLSNDLLVGFTNPPSDRRDQKGIASERRDHANPRIYRTKRARNYSLGRLPRWRNLTGSTAGIFLKFPQKRRCGCVWSSSQRTSDKIDSLRWLVLLDPRVRFLQHYTQNIVVIRVASSRLLKIVCRF